MNDGDTEAGGEGVSNEWIPGILSRSVPAVKSRLHRARLFLMYKLSDHFY